MKKTLFIIVSALLFFISLQLGLLNSAVTHSVQAQITNPVIGGLGDRVDDASSGVLFAGYFILLWNVAITAGGILVIVYFLWGAIEWITAGGDSGKIEKARSKILHAVLGLIILVASFVIIGFLGELLFEGEFNLLEINLPSAFKEFN